MTFKILSGYVQGPAVGYYLSSGFTYTGLSVAANGTVEGHAGVNAGQTPNHASAGYAGLSSNKIIPIINSGQIIGGHGGAGGVPASPSVTIGTAGYAAGDGVRFNVSGYLHNLATITGGAGGASGGGTISAGQGGGGVYSNAAAPTVNNGGSIRGGDGGGGGTSTSGSGGGAAGRGGRGGAAISLNLGGNVSNSGTLTGGDGGVGGLATVGVGGRGGGGGAGLFEGHGGIFANSGAIFGGKGGHGGQGASGGGDGGYGGAGVELFAAAVLTNSGTIVAGTGGAGGSGSPSGAAGQAGYGVYLFADAASVINATETATIIGGIGVKTRVGYVNTINNYGTIQGTTGVAVLLQNAADRLIDEPGSVTFGTAVGGGGTLELAPGFGTIGGMGLASAATFTGFGLYDVDSGGDWTIAGDNEVRLGATLSNAGVLDLTGTLTNYGSLTGSNSYLLTVTATGRLVNIAGGVINGAAQDGVVVAGIVLNYGSITAVDSGVQLQTGGSLTNRGVIDGATGVAGVGAGTLSNYGSIGGTGQAAAVFFGGGVLVNLAGGVVGGANDGFVGLGVSVANAGTIRGSGATGYGGCLVGDGVATNAATGVMEGYSGVVLSSSTLTNFGLVDGYNYAGVYVNAGGSGPSVIINRATGIIEGAKYGVISKGAVTVTNFGSVDGTGGTAVAFGAPGGRLIVKSGAQFGGALVGGGGTLEFANGGGGFTLTSAGAAGGGLSLASSGFATYQLDGGTWTMAAPSAIAAGQSVADLGTLAVSGVIDSAGTLAAAGAGTITLKGSIVGVGAVSALDTSAGGAIRIANASVAQIAGVLASSGTIALASAGSNTDLRILAGGASLTGGGTVSMSGAKARILGITAASTLTNVDNTIMGRGFIGLGAMTLKNGATGVIEASTTGDLDINTKGEVLVNGGLLESTLSGAFLVLNSTTIDQSAGGTIAATAGRVDLQNSTIIGGTFVTSGTGLIRLNSGASTIDAATHPVALVGELQVTGATTLTMSGIVTDSGKLNFYSGKLIVGGSGLTLTGGGQINLNDSSKNTIIGATTTASLVNTNVHISGAGALGGGSMALSNEAGGVIVNTQAQALRINTGTNTIQNSGIIEADGKGGVTVTSAIGNTGTLLAVIGTLTLDGAVTGTGIGKVNGGTLNIAAAFNETVTLLSTGTVKLTDYKDFTGKVQGLSSTGTNAIDLATFTLKGTTATYSGTTASGVLTVTDGTHTAKIALLGNYTASTFTLSDDGHGGTKVVDPQLVGTPQSSPAPLAQAMAGFEYGPPPHLAGTPAYRLPRFPLLHARV